MAAAALAGRLVAGRRDGAAVATHMSDHANHYHLSFGPTNVGLHHVAALVSLGDGALAVAAAGGVDEAGTRALRRERRATYLIDVARGYNQWGKRDEALEKLLEAEAVAPREVNCRPVACRMIDSLMKRSKGTPTRALACLAERSGIIT
jgi:hypothetical protein